jgi:hypothetical protein
MACCSHEHDCEAESCGASSLHEFINHAGVTCLNAADADAAKAVLRPWHERRLRTRALESLDEGEPELLLHIPFTTDVKARRYAVSCVCSAAHLTQHTLCPRPAAWNRCKWRRRRLVAGGYARVHQPRRRGLFAGGGADACAGVESG